MKTLKFLLDLFLSLVALSVASVAVGGVILFYVALLWGMIFFSKKNIPKKKRKEED